MTQQPAAAAAAAMVQLVKAFTVSKNLQAAEL